MTLSSIRRWSDARRRPAPLAVPAPARALRLPRCSAATLRWALIWAAFLFVVVVRFCSAVYLLLLGVSHGNIHAYGPYAALVYTIWAPGLMQAVFFLLALLNLFPLAKGACRTLHHLVCDRGARLSVLPLMTSPVVTASADSSKVDDEDAWGVISASLGPLRRLRTWLDDLFGVRGRRFAELLAAAQVLEIVVQSRVFFLICEAGLTRVGVVSFAALLAGFSASSPAMLLFEDVNLYRDASILIDAAFRFSFNTLWPCLSLLNAIVTALRCGGLTNDPEVVAQNRVLIQYVLVSDAWEAVLRIVPFVSMHVLLSEVWAAVETDHGPLFLSLSPVAAAREPPAVTSRRRAAQHSELKERRWPVEMRRLAASIGLCYAISVCWAAGWATTDRCADEPLCTAQAFSLTNSEQCMCTIVDAQCAPANGFSVDADVLQGVVDRNSDSLRVLDVEDCGLSALPAAAAEATKLWFVLTRNNSLVAAPELEYMEELHHVDLRDNLFEDVPQFHAGASLLSLQGGHNRISMPRSDLSDVRHLVSLGLQGNANLTGGGALGCEWGRLPLVHARLAATGLSGLECTADGWGDMQTLSLGSNELQGLPQRLVDRVEDLHAGGNPLCASSENAAEAYCEPGCSATCAPMFVGDGVCDDLDCGTEACGFDGGDCAAAQC